MGFQYSVHAVTDNNKELKTDALSLADITAGDTGWESEKNGFRIKITKDGQNFKVRLTPPEGTIIQSIKHIITTGHRNFHEVICPDSGRNYSNQMQLVNFWKNTRESAHFDIKAPVFIFTGQNHYASFAFGIIGPDYETKFEVLEPGVNRALLAYHRRLTLAVSRGYPGRPMPVEYAEMNPDHSIEEVVFVRDYGDNSHVPWLAALKDLADSAKTKYALTLPRDKRSLEPLWCSWTDWHSSQVDEKTVLENVKAGVELGVKNYIIDDGWFGPGLDNNYGTKLIFGDWEPDGERFRDMAELSRRIRKAGGRSIIWCAPHCVTPTAKSFRKNYEYLIKDEYGVPVLSSNKLNLYCPRCAGSRALMADICVRLAEEYDTDGAKYDLFNSYPNERCRAVDHTHDTESDIVGLSKLMELIWTKVREKKPDYIIELKQNYGWVFLSRWGSMVRAGDTPYNSEGNFMRTAFISAYTPYAVNDYQTITAHDSIYNSARIVIKMMAAGIPAYSMDIPKLPEQHKKMLKFYNEFYLEMIKKSENPQRYPLDADMGIWLMKGVDENCYFAVNEGTYITIDEKKNFSIANGNITGRLNLSFGFSAQIEVEHINSMGEYVKTESFTAEPGAWHLLDTDIGALLKCSVL